jgi:hypothetical protein
MPDVMIRFLFRLLSTLALSIAVILAVLDATRSVAASALVVTPLSASWQGASPASFAALRGWVESSAGTGVWTHGLSAALALPGFVVFAILAFVLYALGRRRVPRFTRIIAGT